MLNAELLILLAVVKRKHGPSRNTVNAAWGNLVIVRTKLLADDTLEKQLLLRVKSSGIIGSRVSCLWRSRSRRWEEIVCVNVWRIRL